MENYNYQQQQQSYFPPNNSLPNATAVLVLGILSIVFACCYGLGLVLGIIALVLAAKDIQRYKTSPELYAEWSYKNLKAGRVCAIVGVSIFAFWVFLLIVGISLTSLDSFRELSRGRY
jgi:hypothetical protein